jgi:hypothetical protein
MQPELEGAGNPGEQRLPALFIVASIPPGCHAVQQNDTIWRTIKYQPDRLHPRRIESGPLIGFSPRKQNLTLYIVRGFANCERNLRMSIWRH